MCGHGGAALRGTPGRRADASFLSTLAAGHRRFGTVAVLISRGPSCDSQAHDSPVTRVVWSAVFFFYWKTDPTERMMRRSLGVERLRMLEVQP